MTLASYLLLYCKVLFGIPPVDIEYTTVDSIPYTDAALSPYTV